MSEQHPAAELESRPPDLTEVPNFDALGKWVGKLKEWCERAADEIHHGRNELGRLTTQCSSYEHELAEMGDARDELGTLWELLVDVETGVRTLDEVMDTWRRTYHFNP